MEGSKVITTEVTTSDLLGQMKDHAYYLGEALKSDPRLIEIGAKIQASSDEDPILKDFINTGVRQIGNLLTRVLGITSYLWDSNKGKVTFTTKAAANFPENQDSNLKDCIVSYLSCHVLSNWLNLVKNDEASRFENMKKEQENEIIQLSAQRSKPLRQ